MLMLNMAQPVESIPEFGETSAEREYRLRSLGANATSLDALESVLGEFDRIAVGGTAKWYQEVGNMQGSDLDIRLHSLGWEMASIADVAGRWAGTTVTKLGARKGKQTPDFVIEASSVTAALESKALLGGLRPWLTFRTVLRTLRLVGEMREAEDVQVVLEVVGATTQDLMNEIGSLSVGDIIEAVHTVGSGQSSQAELGGYLLVVVRGQAPGGTPVGATFSGVDPVPSPPILPSLDDFKDAAVEAWEQCEPLEDTGDGQVRLNIPAVMPGRTRADFPELNRWLQQEVWPAYPYRALQIVLEDGAPEWVASPQARSRMGA